MLLEFATHSFVTLLVTIDPIGLAPLFLVVTTGMSTGERRQVAYRASIIALIILVTFAFAGDRLLSVLGITIHAFRIAGGLLLFWTAFEMVFEKRQQRKSSSAQIAITLDHIRNVAVFPLAIPLISGPGAISAVILLSTHAPGMAGMAALLGVVVVLIGACLAAFVLANPIDRLLGQTGRVVLTRLLGVLLAALAVQFIADGVKGFTIA